MCNYLQLFLHEIRYILISSSNQVTKEQSLIMFFLLIGWRLVVLHSQGFHFSLYGFDIMHVLVESFNLSFMEKIEVSIKVDRSWDHVQVKFFKLDSEFFPNNILGNFLLFLFDVVCSSDGLRFLTTRVTVTDFLGFVCWNFIIEVLFRFVILYNKNIIYWRVFVFWIWRDAKFLRWLIKGIIFGFGFQILQFCFIDFVEFI